MSRSFLAPEYHQISMMDCGVGALACFLRAYGIDANYERLREACQTSVDGTSIEALEQLANDAGVDVVQHLVPSDLIFEGLEGRWPAIAVVKTEGRPPHFVTLWRKLGCSWLHVMDPARGRAWETRANLVKSLYQTTVTIGHDDWRDWFLASSFRQAMRARAFSLLPHARAASLVDEFDTITSPHTLAAAEAALRLVAKAQRASPQINGRWRAQLFERAYEAARESRESLPEALWAFRVTPEGLAVTAAVFLAVDKKDWRPQGTERSGTSLRGSFVLQKSESRRNIWGEIYDLLSPRARALLAISVIATFVGATATAFELLLARAASWDAARMFPTLGAKTAVVVVAASLFGILAVIEALLGSAARAMGRELEVRLRATTFELLPRVDDTFVRSRPTGDLAYRAHALELGRSFPTLIFSFLRAGIDIFVTLVALTIIQRNNLTIILVGGASLAILTYAMQSRLREIDSRFQAHGARLLDLFLDALRGFRPVRLHGFQNALRAEQGQELIHWRETGEMQSRARAGIEALQGLITILWVGAIFWNDILHERDARMFIIIAFWTLRLPPNVGILVTQSENYAPVRSAFARLLEITRYLKEQGPSSGAAMPVAPPTTTGTVIDLNDVTVVAGGSALLRNVSLHVSAGQHVAIVGASGSGKSTLVSLILGFHKAAQGVTLVDGAPLTPGRLTELRSRTAWVDPSVQLWNTTFLENIEYASTNMARRDLLTTLEASDLLNVLNGMDQGLDTNVGADGRLLSGGEGQRLRLGRALLRKEISLAIFDEAFRGLDRETRQRLTLSVRGLLRNSTMLFVSHDISHALDFDRVIVIEDGRIVEDGAPVELASSGSLFRKLLDAEQSTLTETWAPRHWRRVRVMDGRLRDLS